MDPVILGLYFGFFPAVTIAVWRWNKRQGQKWAFLRALAIGILATAAVVAVLIAATK